jgi:hypothetical protein
MPQTAKKKHLFGDESTFPLGSMVFFCVPGKLNLRSMTHVGIVVGFKERSPQIAHAANGENIKQGIISRLQAKDNAGKKLHYMVVKAPDDMNDNDINLLVNIAKSLASRDNDALVIPYSTERSTKLAETINTLAQDKKLNFDQLICKHLQASHKQFKENAEHKDQAAWFASFAKMLNFLKSKPCETIKEKTKSLSPTLKLGFDKLNIACINNDDEPLTHKGWNCVQFVVYVFQITSLILNRQLRAYLNTETFKNVMQDANAYFSRMTTQNKRNNLVRHHPKELINKNQVKYVKAELLSTLIPLDPKELSPMGLACYVQNGMIDENDLIDEPTLYQYQATIFES